LTFFLPASTSILQSCDKTKTTYAFQSQSFPPSLVFLSLPLVALLDNTYRHKVATTQLSYVLPSSSFYLFNHHHWHRHSRDHPYYTKPRHSRKVARMYIRQPSCLSRRASRSLRSIKSFYFFLYFSVRSPSPGDRLGWTAVHIVSTDLSRSCFDARVHQPFACPCFIGN
jgi:hypothetical protein